MSLESDVDTREGHQFGLRGRVREGPSKERSRWCIFSKMLLKNICVCSNS